MKVDARTSKCRITTGTIRDVYSGRDYPAQPTSAWDVDHVVPLAYAWRAGAWKWTRSQRVAFANDPANLVLTTAHTNRSKSDQTPDTWSPSSHGGACWYVNRFALVTRIHKLTTTTDRALARQMRDIRAAIRRTRATC